MQPSVTSELLSDSDAREAVEKAVRGEPLALRDVERLMVTREIHLMAHAADGLRRRVVGDTVTFVVNIILNYTNYCVVKCDFCAFYRDVGSGAGYTLTVDKVVERAVRARSELGVTQLLIQGGVNPDLPIEYYEAIFKRIKEKVEGVAIHGLSTSEIEFIARKSRMSVREVLQRLKAAGMDTVPGAGAEILVDGVRRAIGRTLSTSEGWLRTMEEAHRLGIPTSATMVYGHVETAEDRARHLLLIRELQEKTGGFMAFIPWHMEPGNTQLERDGRLKRAAGGAELIRMIAASRLVFGGLIRNIQSSWLTSGIPAAQVALVSGANDWGGTIFDEEVIPATGRQVGNLRVQEIVRAVRAIGRPVAERDNFYRIVRAF